MRREVGGEAKGSGFVAVAVAVGGGGVVELVGCVEVGCVEE